VAVGSDSGFRSKVGLHSCQLSLFRDCKLDRIGEQELVFLLIVIVGALFASNRVRLDMFALLAVLALTLSGVLTVNEALRGFRDQVVILVAGLLFIGEILARTGIAQSIG
jgi:di/tricarboxylate transporter